MEDPSMNDPFLSEHEKDLDNLQNEYKIFCSHIDELDKNISKMTFNEPSSVQKVESEFQIIKEKINQMNKKITYMKNFITDSHPIHYKKLCSISDNIINKYSKINVKFQEVLRKENTDIQNEINETNKQYNPPQKNQQVLVNKVAYNTNPKIERLLAVKKEYQAIYENTLILSQITREMKETTERQNKTVNSISDSIINVNANANKAHKELSEKNEKEQNSSNKGYYIFAFILVIIICCIIWYLYRKTTN